MLRRRRRIALIAAMAIGLSSILAVQPPATAAESTHYWVNACTAVPHAKLNAAVHRALGGPLKWDHMKYSHGWSECLLVNRTGTFVVLDLASSWMLTRYRHQPTSAAEMANRLVESGGLPPYLQYIGRRHREFLWVITWGSGFTNDVVGVAMFGFFHRVHHKLPRFRFAYRRLSTFVNHGVLPYIS